MLENVVTLANLNSVTIRANQLGRRLLCDYGELEPIAVDTIVLVLVSEKHSIGFRPWGFLVVSAGAAAGAWVGALMGGAPKPYEIASAGPLETKYRSNQTWRPSGGPQPLNSRCALSPTRQRKGTKKTNTAAAYSLNAWIFSTKSLNQSTRQQKGPAAKVGPVVTNYEENALLIQQE